MLLNVYGLLYTCMDDVVLFAETKNNLKNMIRELHQIRLQAGLEINIRKTTVQTNVEYKEPIKIREKTINWNT